MIAARLAGGNLFFAFLVVGDFLWWGILGALGALGALGFFFEGIFLWGDSFFWGVVGCVLDCKCWKKLKND